MDKMKGLIALDIDGTISVEMKPIPQEVVDYLHHLSDEGWLLVFISGRTFQWAYHALQVLSFPYYFAVQNGAIILEMPTRKIVRKKYLNRSIIPVVETICEGLSSDFVIYTGFEYNDVCYYRANHFSQSLLEYLKQRQVAFLETWQNVSSLSTLPMEEFPSIKCIGNRETASVAAKGIEERLGLHIPIIKDPFNEDYFVAQATHPDVNKGCALDDIIDFLNFKGAVIAAGDDNNDQSMLAKADIKVVMATAPQNMLANADIVAPPATEKGILIGLREAIKRLCLES
jgi:hydroxymethylpyrimidine pyrophosphatase-like HAD family hydrolase